jgi:hypothetical protein
MTWVVGGLRFAALTSNLTSPDVHSASIALMRAVLLFFMFFMLMRPIEFTALSIIGLTPSIGSTNFRRHVVCYFGGSHSRFLIPDCLAATTPVLAHLNQ